MSGPAAMLDTRGWQKFDHDPEVADWVGQMLPHATASIAAPENAQWLRCGGTWFAGVSVLANTSDGRVGGSVPLRGRVIEAVRAMTGQSPNWDAAQVSVVYPGYPKQGTESDAAYRYRVRRDAAHVDGLLRVGADRHRAIREPHAFILGIPLTDSDPGASPLVVWEGSNRIMRAALRDALRDHPPASWPDIDVTDAYKAARRICFETCPRITVHARPGEAYLIHRLALHGISPWHEGAVADAEGRGIAYFRPVLASVEDWLAD